MDEWIAMWNTLRTRHDGTPEGKKRKADDVDRAGRAIVINWGQWAGSSALKYYAHALNGHLGAQVCARQVIMIPVLS